MRYAIALAGALAFLCASTQAGAQTYRHDTTDRKVIVQIVYHRQMTWRFQDRMHHKRLPTAHRERRASPALLPRLKHYWEHRHFLAWRAWKRSHNATPTTAPPHASAWLCIHKYEGAWNANTGNGFYGGLQMDWGFMTSYGAVLLRTKGTADNWTPLEQMWVAERAYSSGRGFYPWPNTARYCGLI